MTTATLDYETQIPEILQALAHVHEVIDAQGIEVGLKHLVLLRASQINRCGFCVEMHTREARRDGETNERLDQVIVWNQVELFTPRERAALAWTEALTELDPRTDLSPLRDELCDHFTDEEVGALTATIGMINLWNRLSISRH
ncbi:MAG: carboxymuconolactone decarboxylase family protein [Planctomycetota bacterium]